MSCLQKSCFVYFYHALIANVPVKYLSQQDFTSKGKLSFITAPSVVFENDTLFDKVHFLEALFEQAMSFEISDQQWLSKLNRKTIPVMALNNVLRFHSLAKHAWISRNSLTYEPFHGPWSPRFRDQHHWQLRNQMYCCKSILYLQSLKMKEHNYFLIFFFLQLLLHRSSQVELSMAVWTVRLRVHNKKNKEGKNRGIRFRYWISSGGHIDILVKKNGWVEL